MTHGPRQVKSGTGSAIFHYLGPSFAVLLFASVSVGGVAWIRIVSAALVFAGWRRPWRAFAAASRGTRRSIVGLGVVFALMNYSFYLAIERLPLDTVAAIEFIGPIFLAVVAGRSRRNLAALAINWPWLGYRARLMLYSWRCFLPLRS